MAAAWAVDRDFRGACRDITFFGVGGARGRIYAVSGSGGAGWMALLGSD